MVAMSARCMLVSPSLHTSLTAWILSSSSVYSCPPGPERGSERLTQALRLGRGGGARLGPQARLFRAPRPGSRKLGSSSGVTARPRALTPGRGGQVREGSRYLFRSLAIKDEKGGVPSHRQGSFPQKGQTSRLELVKGEGVRGCRRKG